MLIKTIEMETRDTSLFNKKTPLLPAASELAYHTINCSALNVEELRRENGIEVKSYVFQNFFICTVQADYSWPTIVPKTR